MPTPGQPRVVDGLPPGEQGVASQNPGSAGRDHLAPVDSLAVERRRARCRHGQRLAGRQHVGACNQLAAGQRRAQVGAQRLGQAHGAFHVEQPCALRQQAARRQRLRGVLQDGLDQRRRQARVGLQQQGHGARDDRGRSRGSAEFHQLVGRQLLRRTCVLGQLRIGGRQVVDGAIVVAGQGAQDTVARSHQVRLDEVVGPPLPTGQGHATPGGPARTEAGHGIVCAPDRGRLAQAGHPGRAHRDDRGLVPRRRDAAVDRLAGRVLAVVTSCGHHHDARRGGAAGAAGQRIDDE